MKTIRILSLALFIFTFSSCDEGNEIIVEPDAYLVWTKKFDKGGCGYFIKIDTTLYKPTNEGIIPLDYRSEDPLSVTIQYIDLLYNIELNCSDTLGIKKAKAIKLNSMDVNEELD